MQSLTYLVLLGAIWKLVDAVKNVSAKNFRSVFTQVLSAGAGIGTAFLISASDFAETWDVGAGMMLKDMNGASLVILGLVWGLGTGAAVDIKKALDGSDTSRQPELQVASNARPADPGADPLGGGR